MRRNLLCLATLFFTLVNGITNAQTLVFSEDFEVVDSMASSGTPTWFQDANYHTNGSFSIRDTIAPGGTAYLTSNAFSTSGNFFVQLYFDHICKINFADRGYVEVSNDNGNTWVQLDGSHYTGASAYFPAFHYFSSFSYGASGWNAPSDTATPQSSWWRTEPFDISSVAGNSSQVKIRFRITDGNGNGNSGNYGWLIDNVHVHAAPNELNPPFIRWSPPVMQGTIYYLGPFTISDTITDASAFSANVHYTVNGGPPVVVAMINTSGNIWQGTIPAMNDGDTICYYVQASDIWNNTAVLPNTGCNTFIASSGITFPYVDNFDINTNLWTSTTTSGSSWELGAPAFGQTNSVHSAPNAWDIALTSGYLNNTNTTLTSPVFNFIGVYNAKLSFWRNHNCETGWDGTRLEYTTNGTLWQILGTFLDPLGTNWYTTAHINSSNTAAWAGPSAGWVLSTYKLNALNNVAGPVQFRFIFTADGAVTQDGFSIDDISIIPASPQDAGVASILHPGFSTAAGSNDTVQIVISNFGNLPVSNFNVQYSINGGAPVTQLYLGTLQPGNTDTIIFSTPYPVPTGAFNICAYTSLTGDGNHTNDTLCKNSQGIPLISIPYTDNFDTLPAIWYDSSAAGTSWQLGTPNFGATNSAYSAPNAWDINLNTTYGNDARAVLTSPLFDFTGLLNAKLSFWMNRNIAAGDGAFLEYSVNGGTSWQRLGTVNDPNALNNLWYNNANLDFTSLPGWDGNSAGWKKYMYVLGTPFNNAGPNVQFRFIFTSNFFTTTDGISIDNFAIMPAMPVDVGVSVVIQPGTSSAAGSSGVVQVTIKNFGSTTVTTTDIGYQVNGTFVATESWNGSLAPSATSNFTFAAVYAVPAGNYDICAYTSLLPDGDHTNDTLCKTSHGIPRLTLPYADNFDTGSVFWVDNSAPGTNWQHGTPAFGVTTGSHSPPSCWDINLTSAYGNNALSYLVSPLFDFTGVTNARLSFWQNRRTEASWDGTRLEYSTNAGTSWTILGIYNDPNAANWYTDAQLNSSNLPGWDNIFGWAQSIYWYLPAIITGADVMFRFVFTSDGSVTQDGISIDDFSITLPVPNDVGITSILHPGNSAPSNTNDSVRVVIYNFGSAATANFPVAYRINAGSPVIQTYTGTLQPGIYDTLIFTTTYLVPSGAFNICSWTASASDGNHLNDTLCRATIGQQLYALPYSDNFDTGISIWTDSSAGAGTNWQHGTPAFGQTTGAYSPSSCWDINLNSPYAANAESYLVSPLFDFTGITNARVSFWQNRNTESLWDGTRLEYSTNSATTWTILGTYNDPNAINWYNDLNINSSGLSGWDDISLDATGLPGWQQSTYLALPSIMMGQYVVFRFVFTSDGVIETDGISIDNFQLFVPTVGITQPGIQTNTLKIYPNPSSGIFYVAKEDLVNKNSSIIVTDVLGNEIWTGSQSKTTFTSIDLSSKPNGIYFVSVVSDSEIENQRIILCK